MEYFKSYCQKSRNLNYRKLKFKAPIDNYIIFQQACEETDGAVNFKCRKEYEIESK